MKRLLAQLVTAVTTAMCVGVLAVTPAQAVVPAPEDGAAVAAAPNCTLDHSHYLERDSDGGWWAAKFIAKCNSQQHNLGIKISYKYWGESQQGSKTYFEGGTFSYGNYFNRGSYAGKVLAGRLGFARYCYNAYAEYQGIPGGGSSGVLTKRTGNVCWYASLTSMTDPAVGATADSVDTYVADSATNALQPACRANQFNIAIRDRGVGAEWGLNYECFGLRAKTTQTVRAYEDGVLRKTNTFTTPGGPHNSGTVRQYVDLKNRNPHKPAKVKVVWHYNNGLQFDTHTIERDIWYDPND